MKFDETIFFSVNAGIEFIELPDTEAHHAIHVLRLKEGTDILITDGIGALYDYQISAISKKGVQVRKTGITAEKLTPPAISLAAGLIKKPRFEEMIENVGQFPLHKIIPFTSKRTQQDPEFINKGKERLDVKLITAMKQSRQRFLPQLQQNIEFSKLIETIPDYDATLLFEKTDYIKEQHSRETLQSAASILLIIGPEGGLTSDEIEAAQKCGATVTSLGATRLRAETAAIAAITKTLILKGEL